MVDFLEQAERLDKGQAIQRLRELAGGAAPDPAAIAAQAARRAAAARQEAQEAAQRTALARRIWSEAEYLTRRSDPLAVGLSDRAPRHHPLGQLRPALASAVPMARRHSRLHRRPGRERSRRSDRHLAHQPVMEGAVERRGLGPVKGCFAPVIDHAGLDTLTIAEGVEDALAAWTLTTFPAWATLSRWSMAAVNLPAQFRKIIICADRDDGRNRSSAYPRATAARRGPRGPDYRCHHGQGRQRRVAAEGRVMDFDGPIDGFEDINS